MIKFENVSISYEDKMILKNIELDISKGKKVLVSGKSGIGKSSLIKAILGFVEYKGMIKVDGLEVNRNTLQQIRKIITYMPQEINMPINSVNEFLTIPLIWNPNLKEFKKRAFELLEKFKIEQALLKKQLSEISGGQKQRILLASCIAQDKSILLLDEPDSSMDVENKKIIRDYLMGLDKTILLISHDLEWGNYVDKTINLDNNG